jgi:tRNA (cmo5U34)-methyltransferase
MQATPLRFSAAPDADRWAHVRKPHQRKANMKSAEYNQIVAYLRHAEQSKFSYHDIKARFEAEPAAAYGANMASWIPDFAYTHQLLLESIALHLPPNGSVLELGAGSGRVSQLLLETFPDVHLTLVDISANMLGEAMRQVASYADRCQLTVHDIFDAGLDFPAHSFDGVVSVFAICHAQGRDVYEQLYRRIYHWLKPQGYFVCYDHVLGATFELTALNALGWHRLLCTTQTAEQAKEGIVGTYQEDSPLSVWQHLDLLSAVGFGAVDVLYKRDIFAIYAGIK